MKQHRDVILAYSVMLGLIILVGFLQSWSMALSILCFCLISAVMTMGANIQWGYAGLINFGIMGYTALGGLAAVLVSVPPVTEAWQAGGVQMILCLIIIIVMVFGVRFILKKYKNSILLKGTDNYQRIYRLIEFTGSKLNDLMNKLRKNIDENVNDEYYLCNIVSILIIILKRYPSAYELFIKPLFTHIKKGQSFWQNLMSVQCKL